MAVKPGEEPTALQTAFARYRRAQTTLRMQHKPALVDVEAALEARVELFRCLVESGWQPPEPVARQINLDAVLVEQPHGAMGG